MGASEAVVQKLGRLGVRALGADSGPLQRVPAREERADIGLEVNQELPQRVDERVLLEVARLRSALHMNLGEVLTRPHFVRELRREQLRSDRSGGALSLIVLHVTDDEQSLDRVLRIAADTKREIDLVGWLSADVIAILLPETDRAGAEQFVAKLTSRCRKLVSRTEAATYPDKLIDDVLAGDGVGDDLYAGVPIGLSPKTAKDRYRLKRGLDIAGALAAIVTLAPLMLGAAIAVALSSKGPIIFRQIRIGRDGKPFTFYKFRSMRCDTDDRIHREYVAKLISGKVDDDAKDGSGKPLYKIKDDPRVTAVGQFIRKTSIDELPQLFNVLKGDMSLVGPRPPLPYEVERYGRWHLRRILDVRPGITGYWQVEGRNNISFDEMVRLDLRYIRNCSLGMDVKILFKTVHVVLARRGVS